MNEIENQQNDEIEIDLQRLIKTLLSKSWIIGLAAIVCAVATFLGTFFLITPKYQASAMFYVNNSSLSLGEATFSVSSTDISASRNLVKSYIVILKTRESLNDVIDYSGVNRTYGQLKNMISASAVDSTEIFQVVVTSPDPQEAEDIADAIAYILPKRIAGIIEGSSAKVVDSAVLPSSPSSPNYTKNTMMGFLIGLVLSAALIVLHDLLDITIRIEEDIVQNCKYPVLTAVPDMEAHGKGSRYYGKTSRYYGRAASAYDKTGEDEDKGTALVGGGISFAAAEAYKLLRTKLQFSFADEMDCHIIGVSSALTGEGKSLSAVNLAYSTSQLGKRVLLIDCDMRCPSVPRKLPINRAPGLSDFLTGQCPPEELIQKCGIKGNEAAFHVIAAGRIPPNPIELLSSSRMEKMLALLRKKFDYIILDLPPVGEVSDALVASKLSDGMLLVVRQGRCDRVVLNAAIRQFEFVDAKILGVVFNYITENGRGYGKRYYKKYEKSYYRQYNRDYAAAAKRAGKQDKK